MGSIPPGSTIPDMPEIHLATFTAESRSSTLARLLERACIPHAAVKRTATGKPYLEARDGALYGLAITHLRKASPPLSFMAVGSEPLLGIDTEIWPKETDAAFLDMVTTPEDKAAVAHISAQGRDAATWLWVAKEAALKACGEVLVDPKNISVKMSSDGHLLTSTSRAAKTPIGPALMRIWRFSANGQEALLAIAIGHEPGKARQGPETWRLIGPEFALFPVC